jgi:hypothetical protein
MKLHFALLVLFVFALTASPVVAQAPVVGSSNPEALFTSPDPKLHAN